MWWKRKKPDVSDCSEYSAQLYELHADTGESHGKTKIEQWMEAEPEEVITVVTSNLDTALSYLSLRLPHFKIRTITSMGEVLIILEKSSRKKVPRR